MSVATIAQLIRTAPNRTAAEHIASGLRGRSLQAVADELGITVYGTAANRRGLVVTWGYQRPADRRVFAPVG